MNWLDIVIIISIFLITYGGVKRGLIGEIFDLLIIFGGISVALNLYPYLARIFRLSLHWPAPMANLTSFFSIFIPVSVIIFFIGCVLDRAAKLSMLKNLNSFSGGIFAFIKSWVICWIVVIILGILPFGHAYHANIYRSPMAKTVRSMNPFFESVLQATTPHDVSKMIISVIEDSEERPREDKSEKGDRK